MFQRILIAASCRSLQAGAHFKIHNAGMVQIRLVQYNRIKKAEKTQSLVQRISQVNLAQCTLCWQFED